MPKFTELFIKNLSSQEKDYTLREGDGFTIRVRSSGAKSWIYTYDFLGRRRNFTLGTYPEISLKEARRIHAEAKKLLEKGLDPATENQKDLLKQKLDQEQDRREPTMQKLVEEYIERHAKPKKKSWKEDQRILNKDVIPPWGNRKAKDISKRDVALLIDSVADRGGIMANRTLAAVRKVFAFAVERGILEQSPATQIKAPAKEIRRERVLTPDEIRLFWHTVDSAPMTRSLQIALKLLLVTAQRKMELLSAKWDEFDRDGGWWTMAGIKTKNGQLHRVPLSPLARALLGSLDQTSEYLFPSPSKTSTHITDTSLDHALRRCSFDGVAAFTPHDLRRTAATCMGEMGVNRLIIDKILNHVDRSVGAIYDRHTYDKEKRQALEDWSARIVEIVS